MKRTQRGTHLQPRIPKMFWLGFTFLLGAPALASTKPAVLSSGYVENVSYSLNANGKLRDPKRTYKIWFSGQNTRREQWDQGRCSFVSVTGAAQWTAFFAASRISRVPLLGRPRAYADEQKNAFAEFLTSHTPVGTESIRGRLCRKYVVYEPARVIGDIKSNAHEVRYWIAEVDGLPLAMRFEAWDDGRISMVSEVVEVRSGPVSPSRFSPPIGLAEIAPLKLPPGKFLIELEERRASEQNGWNNTARYTFSGDGNRFTRTFGSQNTNNKGASTSFGPPQETLARESMQTELYRMLQTPYWASVRKVGTGFVLDIPVAIYETYTKGLPSSKYWIADHPVLGTICLQSSSNSEGAGEIQVTRLEIETPAAPTPKAANHAENSRP